MPWYARARLIKLADPALWIRPVPNPNGDGKPGFPGAGHKTV